MNKKLLSAATVFMVAVVSAGFTSCSSNDDDDNGGGSSLGKAPATVEAVDLGLSVKWASCNVGATQEYEYGGIYAWGEVTEKDDYSRDTYLYYDTNTRKYQDIGKDIAGTKYDVAHVMWGGKWRMPSAAQMKELIEKCKFREAKRNDVKGLECTGPNGNTIFLPYAPHKYGTDLYTGDVRLWCSSITSLNTLSYAYYAYGSYDDLSMDDDTEREDGFSVRAVMQ